MDYEEQSRKDKPFEGLSPEEAKRLFVYMCYVAHPRLTPEDIEKRWGRVLPPEEIPTVFEAMEIAEKMKHKPAQSHSDTRAKEATSNKGINIGMVIDRITICLIIIGTVVVFIRHKRLLVGSTEPIRKEEKRLEPSSSKTNLVLQAWLREQEELRKQEAQKQEEQRRQEELKLLAMRLINSASESLSSGNIAPKELWEMGLKLQTIREEVHSKDGILTAENMVLLEETVLRCYKKARGNIPPFDVVFPEACQIDACYRIALLYLPNMYRHFVVKEDQVTVLSENEEIAKKYLEEAVECDHYRALSLFCNICQKDVNQFNQYEVSYAHRQPTSVQHQDLENTVTKYRRQLANHKRATGGDVYLFSKWISQISPEESLLYLKKAATMGSADAKKELLLKGITVDE